MDDEELWEDEEEEVMTLEERLDLIKLRHEVLQAEEVVP